MNFSQHMFKTSPKKISETQKLSYNDIFTQKTIQKLQK